MYFIWLIYSIHFILLWEYIKKDLDIPVSRQTFSLVVLQILAKARRNRITFGTQMNQHSSRSHALLCITVYGTDLANGSKTTGKTTASCMACYFFFFYLVDLGLPYLFSSFLYK